MVYVSEVLDRMKICVIIPAYNEASTIAEIAAAVRAKGIDCVVIDDGSIDATGDLARKNGAVVITHQKKSGKGASLRDGFVYAIENNFDGVIAMDADGQHAVSDLDKFIQKAQEFPDCIINGTRMENCKNMPYIRYLTNKFMSAVISFLCGQHIPDSQCGYRFISTRILRSIHLTSRDFEIETEVLLRASRKGFKVHALSIQTIYQNELSQINPLIDTIRFFIFIIKELGRSQ